MLTRRDLLRASLMIGAGALLPGRARRASGQTLPTLEDPLYTAPILDPATIPKFVNPLPVVRDLGLRIDATAGGTVLMRMAQTTQDLLGGGLGLTTPVWGFGLDGQPVSYPGPTFVAASGTPITVQWRNHLPHAYVLCRGDPAAGDVVDTTLHWAFGKTGGSFAADGIPVVTHLHGGHSADEFDGLPEQWFTATGKVGGDYVTNDYVYLNDQEGATLWYHDHALGITRQNVYAGLAGFYLLRDENERFLVAGGLIPGDAHEIEMVIQDRMFYPDGRLAYPDASPEPADDEAETFPEGQPSHQPEFFGRVILVNGKAWPFLEVEPRQYRFRVLNGSDSRFYDLRLAPSPRLLVIGTDGGLLERPVPVSGLTIGPGERYDVIVDFSAFAGRTILVRNTARSPFPRGDVVDPRLDGLVVQFRVRGAASGPGPVAPVTPATDLRPLSGPIPRLTTTRPVRRLLLFEGTDRFGRLQPLLGTVDPTAPADPATGNPRDGTFLWDDPVTETPGLDTTEIGEIHNATEDAHPIHLHLVQFQILDRQRFSATVVPKQNGDEHTGITFGGALRSVQYRGTAKPPAAQEAGSKDTAIMFPGEVTRVIARFDKPGTWVWHCHILSHEDHEMMRRFSVDP